MKYDDVYEFVGQMGRFQIGVCIAICFFSLFSLDGVHMIFVGAEMPHWCFVPELANLSFNQQKYIAIPTEGLGESYDDAENKTFVNVGSYSSCQQFDLNYSRYTEEEFLEWNRTSTDESDLSSVVACHQWMYDRSQFTSTIVSRFDLVCDYESLNQLTSTLYMIGSLVGGVVSGVMADKMGRKKSLLIFIIVKVFGLLMSALGPSYIWFATGRLILGIGSSATFVNAYILLMEIVGPRYRSFTGCSMQVGTSIGFMLQPLVAMLTRSDVTFLLAFAAPHVVVFLYTLIIPESPRWLIVVEQYKRADWVFRQMCRINKTSLPVDYDVKNIDKEDGQRGNYTSLMYTPRMRLRTIVMNVIWFTCSLVYNAMALNVGYLPGDIFINTLLSAGLEIPAIILCYFLLDWKWFGRRGSAVWSFILTAVSLALCIPLEILAQGSIGLTVLNILGKGVAVITYSVLFVYASEIFPTEVRNSAMGVSQMFACLGSVVSPYVGHPMAQIWRPLPYIVLCSFSALSGLLCFLLPETNGHPLHDTIEQAERFSGKTVSGAGSVVLAESANGEKFVKEISFHELQRFAQQPKVTFTSDEIDKFLGSGEEVVTESCENT